MSISKRLILYIILILAVQMALIGYFTYNWTSEYLKDLNIKKIRETNYTIMQQANYIRSKYESISDNFLANPTLQELLLANANSPTQTAMIQNKRIIEQSLSDVNEKIYTIIVAKNGIVYQPLIGDYSRILFEKAKASDVYKQSELSTGGNLWIPCGSDFITGDNNPYLYLCRTYMSVTNLFMPLGQLIMKVPVDELKQVFKESELDAQEYYAIVNSNGKYIYHTQDMSLIGKYADQEIIAKLESGVDGEQIVSYNDEDYLLSYSFYNKTGWNIIHIMPMDIIRSHAIKAINNVLFIMLMSMIIAMPVLVLILMSFTTPIRTLQNTVEKFGNGMSQIRAKTDRLDEIGRLQNSFNQMADKINEQMEKIKEDSQQKRLMEINMLEYQINPHFLYNSLDFINWMAHKSGNEDISEMVTSLARFFRVGLSKGKEYYKVKDELDHVHQYLLINKLRFKDCFRFEIQAEPDVLELSTIKIILQPAVENAIKHGINKYKNDGFIRVSAKKAEDSVIFEVSDNGKGIDKERLEVIQKILASHTQVDMDSISGFGLYNVNMRIWMQFGEGYGATLSSSDGSGTTVRIKIPAISYE